MSDKEQVVELAATPELAAAQWSKLYRENAEFRAEFDKNPRKAISRRVGVDLPAEIKVVVHRKKAGEIHITVPEDVDADELTEETLRDISAGSFTIMLPVHGVATPVQLPDWAADGVYALLRPSTHVRLPNLPLSGFIP